MIWEFTSDIYVDSVNQAGDDKIHTIQHLGALASDPAF